MKASQKVIAQTIATTALKLASLFLTTERLRDEKALSLVYMWFYKLKHGQPVFVSTLLKQMFLEAPYHLVFPQTGGAEALRNVTPAELLTLFNTLIDIYNAKPASYRQRIGRIEWLTRRLNKLVHIHGHQSHPGAYVHSGGQYQFVPFGHQLQGFTNTLRLRHIFVSGQGNACLLRALSRANGGPANVVNSPAATIRRETANQVNTYLDALGAAGNVSVQDPNEVAAYVMHDLLEHLENITPAEATPLLEALIPTLEQGGVPDELTNLLQAILQAPEATRQEALEAFRRRVQDGVQHLLTSGNIILFLKTYINRTLAAQNRFEGESMIRLLARVLNRRVVVHTDNNTLIYNPDAPVQNTLHLYYTSYSGTPGHRNHYNVLLP
jgi:hypothetical protein